MTKKTTRISLNTVFGIVLSVTFMLIFYKMTNSSGRVENFSFPQMKNQFLNRSTGTNFLQMRKEPAGGLSKYQQEKITIFNMVSSYPNTTTSSSMITDINIENIKISPKTSKQQKFEPKIILFWYVPFGDPGMLVYFLLNDRDKINIHPDWKSSGFEVNTPQCGNCQFTYNRDELSNSDAVVFHARDISENSLPSTSTRKQNQVYVWWLEESTTNAGRAGAITDNYFNVIQYVRLSSDIFSPYLNFPILLHQIGKKNAGVDLQRLFNEQTRGPCMNCMNEDEIRSALEKLPKNSMATITDALPESVSNEVANLLKKKKRFVAWIVSNCGNTPGAKLRFDFYKKVSGAGLLVDVYGRCGPYKLPINSRFDSAVYDILSGYKFYLAWENSFHCYGYMTEKVWFNSLYSGAVPVIYGTHRDDVAALLPPKSYIHVEDFNSPKELVEYLQYLDKNITAYAEYLEWRNLARFFKENDTLDLSSSKVVKEASEKELEILKKYTQSGPVGFCGLCKMLNTEPLATKLIPSINEMLSSDRPECFDINKAREMMGL